MHNLLFLFSPLNTWRLTGCHTSAGAPPPGSRRSTIVACSTTSSSSSSSPPPAELLGLPPFPPFFAVLPAVTDSGATPSCIGAEAVGGDVGNHTFGSAGAADGTRVTHAVWSSQGLQQQVFARRAAPNQGTDLQAGPGSAQASSQHRQASSQPVEGVRSFGHLGGRARLHAALSVALDGVVNLHGSPHCRMRIERN